MLVYAAMHIISRPGYELLIDQSIEKAQYFASMIENQPDFELISHPELCLLTYRYIPESVCNALLVASNERKAELNEHLNQLTMFIQKKQREAGKSFVSRTRLNPEKWNKLDTIVFRVVLANPLTNHEVLHLVLEEQRRIAQQAPKLMSSIEQLCNDILAY